MVSRKRRRERDNTQSEDDHHYFKFIRRNYILFVFLLYSVSIMYESTPSGNKKKELPRVRKDLERDIFTPLGSYMFRRAYRMTKTSFYKLHNILSPRLDAISPPKNGGKRDPKNSPYLISTQIRLSIALRYFAGGSPYDIMLNHGVSYKSIYISVWGVVDAVNSTKDLQFSFPSHEQQRVIAAGFCEKSGAQFSNVIGAIDDILIGC